MNDLAELIDCMIYALNGCGNSCTFAQLISELEAVGVGTTGDHELVVGPYNIVLWSCLSAPVIDAIRQLQKQGRISVVPCETLTYAIDGKILKLPIATEAEIYDSPHWCPVLVSTEPLYKRIARRMRDELKATEVTHGPVR